MKPLILILGAGAALGLGYLVTRTAPTTPDLPRGPLPGHLPNPLDRVVVNVIAARIPIIPVPISGKVIVRVDTVQGVVQDSNEFGGSTVFVGTPIMAVQPDGSTVLLPTFNQIPARIPLAALVSS